MMCLLATGLTLAASLSCTGAPPRPGADGAVRSGALAPLVATAPTSAPNGGSDWPNFRGPSFNGISPETGLNKDWQAKPPRMLWKTPMGDNGYAGPSVANGLVYIIDHQGGEDIFRAIDLNTGKDAWTYRYPDADADNYGFSRSTPTVSGGKVYAVSRLGKVYCLDAKTGKPIWYRDMTSEFGGRRPSWEYAWSVLIDGNKAIAVPGGPAGALVALDKETGKTIWQGGGDEGSGYSTPVLANLAGRKQYVVFLAKCIVGVDPESGRQLWRYPWETAYDVNAANPIVIGDNVFVSSGYEHGCVMLNLSSGQPKVRWQNREIKAHFASAVVSGGYLYGTGDPGMLKCINPANGQRLWEQGGFDKSGVIAADGVLFTLTADGTLVMVKLNPGRYQELGRVRPLGGESWTAPVLAQGRLLVRNKGALCCIDLR